MHPRMKVLHLVATLGSGGAEKQLYLLCRESCGVASHEVVALSAGGRWAEPIRALGVPVRCLTTSLRSPLAIMRLRSAIRAARPDIVHCWLPSMNILGALAAGRIPVVASVRNVDRWKPRAYQMLERVVAKLWNAVICNSHAGAEVTRDSGIDTARIFVVPNGIESNPEPAPRANTEITVATACRIVPHKRLDRIVEIARRMPEVMFRIAGDGPERRHFAGLSPANVEWLGEIADPKPLFAASDIFLLTSDREGMSNSLLEAMQAGCIPVVTPVGDNPRIVEHGVSGAVVQPVHMPEAIRKVAGHLESYRQAARCASERYTVTAMAENTLRIYRSLIHDVIAFEDPLPRLH